MHKKRVTFALIGLLSFIIVITLSIQMLTGRADQAPSASQKEQSEPAASTPKKADLGIDIVFAGDTMFDWGLEPILQKKGYDYPFTHVKDKVKQADYSFINAETVFTENPDFKDPDQLFWINSDVKGLQAIENAGFQMINIGNNHTMDYMQPGLLDTLKNIKQTDMEYIGAGANKTEAYQSKEVNIKGKTFRFFSFVRFFPKFEWVATEDKPGVPNGYDLDLVKQTIQEQKGDADYVIVYFHWGKEKRNTPVEYQKEYVKELKELGVDLIVGSHPHWLQGFEYYEGMPVAYSLGNFLFPPYVKGRTAETGLLTATFKGDKVQLSFDPYMIDNGIIVPAKGNQRKQLLDYLESISFGVTIDEEGNIK
nr:CapA family protein [Bacillus xiapuensis]